MSRIPRVLSACLIVVLPGCGQRVSEAVRQEVVKHDPQFAKALEQRDELAGRIALLERELALKKTQITQQMAKLRKDLADARLQVRRKVQQTKDLLKPEQERVRFLLAMATEELTAKRSQRASVGRSISQIRKTLQDKPPGSAWNTNDRARLNAELQELLRETKRLDGEIEGLTKHLRLLNAKQALLRL